MNHHHQSREETPTHQEIRDTRTGHARGGGHRWLMIACCMPMFAVAIVLAATGVIGSGFILVALLCAAMMALMHAGMSHGRNDSGHR